MTQSCVCTEGGCMYFHMATVSQYVSQYVSQCVSQCVSQTPSIKPHFDELYML